MIGVPPVGAGSGRRPPVGVGAGPFLNREAPPEGGLTTVPPRGLPGTDPPEANDPLNDPLIV